MGRLTFSRIALGLLLAAAPWASAANPALASTADEVILGVENALERMEEQYVYLRMLNNLQAALEKELAIVKLMRECKAERVVCTGEGLVQMGPPKPAPQPSSKPAPSRSSPPPQDFPDGLTVRGVVGDEALLNYRGRNISLRRGGRVGGLVVREIHLDFLVLEYAGRRLKVPVEKSVVQGAGAGE